jgi:hypothetical protein
MSYQIHIRRILQRPDIAVFSGRGCLTVTYQILDAWLCAYRIYSESLVAPTLMVARASACFFLFDKLTSHWLRLIPPRTPPPLGRWSCFSGDITLKLCADNSDVVLPCNRKDKSRRTGASVQKDVNEVPDVKKQSDWTAVRRFGYLFYHQWQVTYMVFIVVFIAKPPSWIVFQVLP